MLLNKLKFSLLTGDRLQLDWQGQLLFIISWVKATSAVLSSIIFIVDYGSIRNTKLERFKKIGDMYAILDGTVFFIETSKNIDLQRISWSNYKHHNTLKALVCIAPNSRRSTDKYSQHSSIIWPVWLNGWVFVYELSGCGFESRCSHLKLQALNTELFWRIRPPRKKLSEIHELKEYKSICFT